jgi:hypothetical protein
LPGWHRDADITKSHIAAIKGEIASLEKAVQKGLPNKVSANAYEAAGDASNLRST